MSQNDLPPKVAILANSPLGKKSLEEGQFKVLQKMIDLCSTKLNEEERMLIEELIVQLDSKVRYFNKIRSGLFRTQVEKSKMRSPKGPVSEESFTNSGNDGLAEQAVSDNKGSQLDNGTNRNGGWTFAGSRMETNRPTPNKLLEEMLASRRGSKPVKQEEPGGNGRPVLIPASGDAADSPSASVLESIPKEKTPEDVVRTFIESWNSQDFKAEYDCLGGAMAMIPANEYIARRRQTYYEMNGSNLVQRLEEITESNIVNSEARLKGKRVQLQGNTRRVFWEDYLLHKKDGNWTIVSVRSRQF